MNTTEVKGNWERQKSKLLKKFANLTDKDLIFLKGSKEAMFGRLQIKLGKTKEEMQTILVGL
jgi:uncharacterized protein YjbJ (UPF0337 family)